MSKIHTIPPDKRKEEELMEIARTREFIGKLKTLEEFRETEFLDDTRGTFDLLAQHEGRSIIVGEMKMLHRRRDSGKWRFRIHLHEIYACRILKVPIYVYATHLDKWLILTADNLLNTNLWSNEEFIEQIAKSNTNKSYQIGASTWDYSEPVNEDELMNHIKERLK